MPPTKNKSGKPALGRHSIDVSDMFKSEYTTDVAPQRMDASEPNRISSVDA
jgi:hypothetical protein